MDCHLWNRMANWPPLDISDCDLWLLLVHLEGLCSASDTPLWSWSGRCNCGHRLASVLLSEQAQTGGRVCWEVLSQTEDLRAVLVWPLAADTSSKTSKSLFFPD